MRRRGTAPIGPGTEGEIRSWLRGRDAGPAPDRLRMRVARVAEVPPTRTPWAFLRPVAAVAGVAAVAAAVVVAAAVRSPAVPMASGPAPTSGASPSITPDLYLPFGPWPRTGTVLAVPLDGQALTMLAALAALVGLVLFVYLARRSLADGRRSVSLSGTSAGLRTLRPARTWLARLLGTVLASVLIVAGCGLFQFGQTVPLGYGSSFGSDPAYTLGSRSGTGDGSDGETYVSFTPGGEARFLVGVSNQGVLPLTVTSFDSARFLARQPAGAFISSVELLLPPGATPGGVHAFGGTSTPSVLTQAFHPFELPAQSETVFLLVLHLKECASVAAGPAPAPNDYQNDSYLPTTGYATFGDLPFRYSVLGIERETDVRMFQSVGLVFGSNEVTC